MAGESYNLIFRGEVLEGQEPQMVQRKLAGLLKMDAAQVAKLFSGKPVTLKRAVDRATAAKYQQAFKGAGARLRVAAAEPGATAAGAATVPRKGRTVQAPRQGSGQAPRQGSGQAAKGSLATRLAAQAPRRGSGQAPRQGSGQADAAPKAKPAAAPKAKPAAVFGPAWDLAPTGSELLRPEEKPPAAAAAVPDVSHISAAPANAGSLEDVVPKKAPPPPPDVSAMTVAEVGADLTDPKKDAPATVPDTSALTLSEAGVTLVEPKPVPSVEVDVSGLSLAEAGADLTDGKKAKPAPVPSTDHIELEQTT